MESTGWNAERVELKAEVSRLEEELAESRAEMEEHRSRSNVLTERLSQTLDSSVSLHWESEKREWKKKLGEGRERETRQALLIQKLQQKVVEYRSRCEHLQHHIMAEKREMRVRERILQDERSDNLETTLIRLEEEQQRSVTLTEVNALLRSQLNQSAEANHALQDDLQKLTVDWSKAVEEAGQKEMGWNKEKEVLAAYLEAERSRLMSLWSRVVALRRQCHTVKIATDKDLWELRAEFTRLSSTLLSLNVPPPPPPPPPPPLFTSGPMTLAELEHDVNKEKLESRIDELTAIIKSQELGRQKQEDALKDRNKVEERERELQQEKYREQEKQLEAIRQAIRKLCRFLGSQRSNGHKILPDSGVFNDDLDSVLLAISEVESVFRCGHNELQEAEFKNRRMIVETQSLQQQIARLENEKEELEQKAKLQAVEMKQTLSLLNSEKEASLSLKKQLDESQHRSEDLKKENVQLIQQRERENEERSEMERERQRRVEVELVENAHLCEQHNRTRIERHTLQVALEQERREKTRAEKDLADTRDSLAKARESLLSLSSTHVLLQRETADSRDSLEKMATLNDLLTRDKRELSARNVQLEEEVTECQLQLQHLKSDIASLQKELNAVLHENTELRALRNADLDSLYQLRERESEMERELRILKEERERESFALTDEKLEHEQLSEEYSRLCVELCAVKDKLEKAWEQSRRVQIENDELQREKQRLEEQVHRMGGEKEEIKHDTEDLRIFSGNLQQQLCVAKEHTGLLEVQHTQLQMQVQTLQQAKGVLHGEIKCLQSELERNSLLREEERRGRVKEQFQHDEELKNLQLEIRRLNDEAKTSSNNHKIHEEDREKWQREREALNSELGLKDGEMGALRNRMEGLSKENDNLAVLISEKDKVVERLLSEIRSLEMQMKEVKAEVERQRERLTDTEREKEGLLERVRQGNENLKISEIENVEMADILKMRDSEIAENTKRVAGLTENVRLQDTLMEKLKRELNEKDIEVASAVNKVKINQTEREAEELKLKEELINKETELKRIQDNVEELKMEIQHMSVLMQERDSHLATLKSHVVDLEQTDKESQDEIKRWKEMTEDLTREKESLSESHVSVKRTRDELSERLRERDRAIKDLKKNEQDLLIDIERMKEANREQGREVEGHQSTIVKLLKGKNEHEEKWKMQLEEMKKAKISIEEEKYQLEEEKQNMTQEMEALLGKNCELKMERAELKRQILEQQDQLQIHTVWLKDKELEVEKLRKTSERNEQLQNERVLALEEKLKERELLQEKERTVQRECEQTLQLTRKTLDQVEENVKELEMKNKHLTEEVDELRKSLIEQSTELESKSKLLQEYEESVGRLTLTAESGEEEREQLEKSLNELRGREEEKEALEIALEHQIRDLENSIRMKDEVIDALEEKADLTRKKNKEEIKQAKLNKDTMLAELMKLNEEVTVLSSSKERAEAIMNELGIENKKIKDGLKAGLEEMVKLKEMLEESRCEGEKLWKIVEEKKIELITERNKVMSTRDELEYLKRRAQILQKENQELHAQLWIREDDDIRMNYQVKDVNKRELEVHETLGEKIKDKNNQLKKLITDEDAERQCELRECRLEIINKKQKEENSESNRKNSSKEEQEITLFAADMHLKREAEMRIIPDVEEEGARLIEELGDVQVKTSMDKNLLVETTDCPVEENLTAVNTQMKKNFQMKDSHCQTGTAANSELQADVYDLKKEAGELSKEERTYQLEKTLQMGISCREESQERVCAMQRAVAELELKLMKVQQRNGRLERRIEKLRLDKINLQDTLKQVELEREKLRCQLSHSEIQDHRNPSEADELMCLRTRTSELSAQVHQLRLLLASDHQERSDFIDRSLGNTSLMQTLRQDLKDSLTLVSKHLGPSILDCETRRLGRSIREEQLRSSLSHN